MKRSAFVKIIAVLSGLAGIGILIGTIYPIASYQSMSRRRFPTLLSPVVESKKVKLEDYDYTKASNWFEGSKKEDFSVPKVAYYNLSIPKLRIKNATVAIGGEDLSDSLIQYPGTAVPGRNGNSVIFGHSILPKFYNPEDYMSIFSTLSQLNKGDEIYIRYDGVEYLYRVVDMFEVLPTDIQVLEQDTSNSFLSLITCTPPGDPRKPKRLIVRAKIVPNATANAVYKNVKNYRD